MRLMDQKTMLIELLEKLILELGYTFCRYTYPDLNTGETVYAVKIRKNGRPVTPTMDIPKETWESLELLADTQVDKMFII